MKNINYFYSRLAELGQSKDRDILGERELETFMTLLTGKSKSLFGINKINPFCGKNILDVGCGDQYLKKSFEKYGGKYLGIDINTCDFNKDRLPLNDDSQDIVIFLAVIEHLKNPNNILSEIKRVLRSNGEFILSSPDINAVGNKFWNDPTHIHPYNPTSIKKLLNIFNFKEIRVFPNYRCMNPIFYKQSSIIFALSRILPFKGSSKLFVPGFLKGKCSGFFAIAKI